MEDVNERSCDDALEHMHVCVRATEITVCKTMLRIKVNCLEINFKKK